MSSRDSSTEVSPPAERGVAGRRVLIVEDSPVVGSFTADLLEELGCDVIGPVPNMAAARQTIQESQFDAALMDVHIRGERVFPMCELLEQRGIPFLLTSGYADWHIPEKWQNRPRLQKPYKLEELEHALAELLNAAPLA